MRNKQCVVMIDDTSLYVIAYYPQIAVSLSKNKVLQLHKDQRGLPKSRMFEICENQFKKYRDAGIMPQNWDW